MSIAALFIISRNWKEPKWPSTEECIGKYGSLTTIEFYPVIFKNGIKSTSKWMNYKETNKIILSQVTQTQKDE